MAAEAQKVIPGKTSTRHGAQEMSIAVDRLVDTIAGMLLQLPAPQRLEVLRQVEAKVRSPEENVFIRKVTRRGRSFKITLPRYYAKLEGSYVIQVEGKRLIYEASNSGDVRVRNYESARVVDVPIPKWAYEAIGSPVFVRVRVEGSRIVVEPA